MEIYYARLSTSKGRLLLSTTSPRPLLVRNEGDTICERFQTTFGSCSVHENLNLDISVARIISVAWNIQHGSMYGRGCDSLISMMANL